MDILSNWLRIPEARLLLLVAYELYLSWPKIIKNNTEYKIITGAFRINKNLLAELLVI